MTVEAVRALLQPLAYVCQRHPDPPHLPQLALEEHSKPQNFQNIELNRELNLVIGMLRHSKEKLKVEIIRTVEPQSPSPALLSNSFK